MQVPGNFHVATHSSKERPADGGNMQHTIDYVAFGDDVPQVSLPTYISPTTRVYYSTQEMLIEFYVHC